MTIQQIAQTIDKNNWGFSIHQTKPFYKKLVSNAHKKAPSNAIKYEGETVDFIKKVILDNECDEIQIWPSRMTGGKFRFNVGSTITITINNNNHNKTNKMDVNNTQFSALAGLNGLGLNMSEIFTAKDKAAEVIELKQKVERLETENSNLESTNKDLGFDLKLEKSKSEKKNEFVELLKSPQGITLLGTIASKFSPAPALGAPAGQPGQELDKKTEWIINFLEDKETPDLVKDYLIYIIKGYQDKNGSEIIRDVTDVLVKHNIVQSNTQI
jgi:hypothetical protein